MTKNLGKSMLNQTVIRTLIREMLNEVMKTPIDAKMPDLRVDVECNQPGQIVISLTNPEYDELSKRKTDANLGVLVATKKRRMSISPCRSGKRKDLTDTAWEITWSKAREGWGPFLYHLMLQIIEERDPKSAGLMADRNEVTDHAFGVWSKFDRGIDPNIEKEQLDDLANTLTDDPDDNCSQRSNSIHYAEPHIDDPSRKSWLEDSPITKVYRRKPGARDWRAELIELGIYYENGVQVSPWDAD